MAGQFTIANPDEISTQDDEEQKPEETKKKKLDAHAIITILIGIGALAIICSPVVLAWHYEGVTDDTNTTVKQVDGDITVFDTKIKKEKGKNDIDVKGKQAKIDQLMKPPTRVIWSDIVTELERVTRNTTAQSKVDAIFSYTTYSAQAEGTVAINGFTNSYPAIADLIEGLEASPMFEQVKFTSASKSKDSIVSLNLTFKLERPKEEPKQTDSKTPAPTQPNAAQSKA